MAQSTRALQAYRVILRTIRTVFEDDLRMQQVGNHQARIYFEKYKTISDPKKIDYLINEAYQARDALYRDVMKLDYSATKGRHVGVVEKRHLQFEDGTNVYQTPLSGRGLGQRNDKPIQKPTNTEPTTTTTSKIKLTTQTTTATDTNAV